MYIMIYIIFLMLRVGLLDIHYSIAMKFVNNVFRINIFLKFYKKLFLTSIWTFSEYVYLDVQIYLGNQRSQPKKKSCDPKPSIHMSN